MTSPLRACPQDTARRPRVADGADGDATLAAARDAIREGSRSFAAASRLFAPPVRDSVTLLYAWCRHCDDEVDGQRLGGPMVGPWPVDPQAAPAAARARLARLRERTAAVLGGEPPPALPFAALAQVLRRHPIPAALPLAHLEGFAMDVEGTRYGSLDALLPYCWRVAGVVGEMMAIVMGASGARALERASDLGIAFQLTNIARDVVDDARDGRIYLPRDWLAQAGIPPDELVAPRHRVALAGVAHRLLDAAEPYYASARLGLGALPPRSAWAVATALATYRAIGPRLRARGAAAWDERVATSRAEKARHALAALPVALAATVAAARAGRGRPDPARAGLWTPER
jgi:phytoene synthase